MYVCMLGSGGIPKQTMLFASGWIHCNVTIELRRVDLISIAKKYLVKCIVHAYMEKNTYAVPASRDFNDNFYNKYCVCMGNKCLIFSSRDKSLNVKLFMPRFKTK